MDTISWLRVKKTFKSQKKILTNKIQHKTLQRSGLRSAIMTIIDDDGRPDVYTNLKPILEAQGVPLVSAIPTNRVIAKNGTALTLPQMKELQTLGMEFIGHTADHLDLITLTESEIDEQLRVSHEWLRDNNFTDNIMVYPWGHYNDIVLKYVRKYYRGATKAETASGRNIPPINSLILNRMYLENQVTSVKANIDNAITNNEWLIVGMHCYTAEWTAEQLNEVINYAKAQGIEIVSMSEGFNRFGNMLETPEFTIDCDGNSGYGDNLAYISLGKFHYITASTPNEDSLITDFPKGLSVRTINATNNTGLAAYRGVLQTYRMSDDYFSFQLYNIFADGLIYRREWNNTSNVWKDWVLVTYVRYFKTSNISVGTVTANSSKDVAVTSSAYTASKIISAQPTSLPAGIIYNSFISTNGTLTIRLTNITASDIDCGTMTWNTAVVAR